MTDAIKVLLQRQSGFLQLESILFIYYSNPGLLNSILAKFLNKTCPTLFWPPLYLHFAT
jgi:hypothetical protein